MLTEFCKQNNIKKINTPFKKREEVSGNGYRQIKK